MQPDPLDAPDWLVELLADHTFNHRGKCECGRISGNNPEYIRAHVAAVVWAAITERVEAWGDLFRTRYRPDTEHLLDTIGGDDD